MDKEMIYFLVLMGGIILGLLLSLPIVWVVFVKPLIKQTAKELHDELEQPNDAVKFATWLQDNYSQNAKQGGKGMCPRGSMRKDFTDTIYTINGIYQKYITT